jgi:D-glucosaminate-6-phosphate ammonia-lyase
MGRTFKLLAIFAVSLVTVFVMVVPAMGAYATDVTGEWKLTVESPNGTGTPTVTFKQDGETLTGTYKGRFGEAPLKGTVKGNDIKFSLTISPQGQDLQIDYTGTVDGDTMKGKAKFGDLGEGTFTGKKAAPTPKPANGN